jgi:preprotein translocase subunit SecD
MRRDPLRTMSSLLLVMFLLGACGTSVVRADVPPPPPPGPSSPAPSPAATERPVLLRFALDVPAARRAGLIAPEVKDQDVLLETTRIIRARLERFGVKEHRLSLLPPDRFEFLVPKGVDPEGVKRVVTATGDLQFRVEVLPVYSSFRNEHGQTRAREHVWQGARGSGDASGDSKESFEGTTTGFFDFKTREVERWKQAQEKGEPYVPLDPRYRVVPRERTERASPDDFALVEEPREPAERLGRDILTNVRPCEDSRFNPQGGVCFDVKPAYQDALAAWTAANIGLPFAILIDGAYHSAPIVNSPLRDSVVISLSGGSPDPAAEGRVLVTEQEELVAVLQSGRLKVALRFEEQPKAGTGK